MPTLDQEHEQIIVALDVCIESLEVLKAMPNRTMAAKRAVTAEMETFQQLLTSMRQNNVKRIGKCDTPEAKTQLRSSSTKTLSDYTIKLYDFQENFVLSFSFFFLFFNF